MSQYLLIAIAVLMALLSLASWQLWESWQREAKVRGQYAAFQEEVRDAGERAIAAVKEDNRKRKENANATRLELNRLQRLVIELRNSTSVRPDGSAVPITSICAPGTDGAACQFVPIADYRALEDRARQDAARLIAWEEWRVLNNIPVAGIEHDVEKWQWAYRLDNGPPTRPERGSELTDGPQDVGR